MTLSDPVLGSPPAVSDDMVEAWRIFADGIDDALAMGGEPGLELLLALMPDWREAVADINAARMTCVNLIQAGRRDEGLGWHAAGFHEVAERLTPERPGWEDWERAFEERGVATPRIDRGLQEAVAAAGSDLQRRDPAGRSLAELVDALRKNVLSQGSLGERLTILEAIRRLDAASPAWTEMIAPIRRRRAEEIAGELRAAIAREDRYTVERLRREVETTEWIEGLPPAVPDLLAAMAGLSGALDMRRQLESTAAALPRCSAALRSTDWRSPAYDKVLGEAMQLREGFVGLRGQIEQFVREASRLAETGAWVRRSGIIDAVRRVDAAVQDDLAVLDSQKKYSKIRADYVDLEDKIGQLVAKAPLHGGTWEEIKSRGRRWLETAGKALSRASQLQTRSRMELAPSTAAAVDHLQRIRGQVVARIERVEGWERRVVTGLLALVGGVAVVLIGSLILFAVFR
jgi:hypothetical protein